MFQCTYRDNGKLVDCKEPPEYYAWYQDCGNVYGYLCKTHAELGLLGVGGGVVTQLRVINRNDTGSMEHSYHNLLKDIPGETIQQKLRVLLTCYELNCGEESRYRES